MNFELFVGLRYLLARSRQAFISVIGLMSVGGVCVGVTALIVVLAVMNGFDEDLRERIVGNISHVIVEKRSGIAGYGAVADRVAGLPHVEAAAPFLQGQSMIRSAYGTEAAVVKGVVAPRERAATRIEEYVIAGGLPVPVADGESPGVLLGAGLAQKLRVGLGSPVSVIASLSSSQDVYDLDFSVIEAVVCGMFASGLYEYDAYFAYLDLSAAQALYDLPDVAGGIEVRLDDLYLAPGVRDEIVELLGPGYTALTWMEGRSSIFSALKLEKLVMFIILALIVVVAAFNIISTLIMVVMEKTRDIGVLRAIGAPRASILRIFVIQGVAVGAVGTVLGCGLGSLLCWLLARYQFIHLPGDVYLLDTLPVRMEAADVALICVSAVALSLLASLYPAWQAARLDPVEAIRYE